MKNLCHKTIETDKGIRHIWTKLNTKRIKFSMDVVQFSTLFIFFQLLNLHDHYEIISHKSFKLTVSEKIILQNEILIIIRNIQFYIN